MKKFSKGAFMATMTLICYAGFATAQTVSFDNAGDLGALINGLKFGGPGGPGGGQFNHVNPPVPVQPGGGFGHQDHGFGPGNHDGPGPMPGPWHPQPGPQPGPWNPQPGPQPGPWHPQPGPQPDPWHPQPGPLPGPWNPQPGPWQPHHNGHPDWNNNDWGNNHWNHHGPDFNGWWNNYDLWWVNNIHPYSVYRTVCDVTPGISAKGFIVEETMPFLGSATFYYYNAFDTLIGTRDYANSVYRGGDGTPIFDFYQVPSQAEHCFLGITR